MRKAMRNVGEAIDSRDRFGWSMRVIDSRRLRTLGSIGSPELLDAETPPPQ